MLVLQPFFRDKERRKRLFKCKTVLELQKLISHTHFKRKEDIDAKYKKGFAKIKFEDIMSLIKKERGDLPDQLTIKKKKEGEKNEHE